MLRSSYCFEENSHRVSSWFEESLATGSGYPKTILVHRGSAPILRYDHEALFLDNFTFQMRNFTVEPINLKSLA